MPTEITTNKTDSEVEYLCSRLPSLRQNLIKQGKIYQKYLLKIYVISVLLLPAMYISPKLSVDIGKHNTLFILYGICAILVPFFFYFKSRIKSTKVSINITEATATKYILKATSHIEVNDIEDKLKIKLEDCLMDIEPVRRASINKISSIDKIVTIAFVVNSIVGLLLSVSANYIFQYLQSITANVT